MSKYVAENWTVEVMDWDDKCRARYTMNFREHDAGRKRLLEAAPALLEALEELLEMARYARFDNGVTDSTGTINEGQYWYSLAADRARAAIAAAEEDV